MRAGIATLLRYAGMGIRRSGHLEKALSMAGGLIGLSAVTLISQIHLGAAGSVGLVASMGASAVLVFAVPHGPLSQPWPVFGGHLVSALIGVACAQATTESALAAPLAVALATGAMQYLRCMHPPGGATALSAVIGGDAVTQMGFHYVLAPVMLNVVTILAIAVLFNFPFRWRRYPATLLKRARDPQQGPQPAAAPVEPAAEKVSK